MNKFLMLQGTSSNVGKSIVTAALCRIMRQDGHHVAPFKAQNMALNSFVTAEGGEMGRAQVVQAEAAGVRPRVEMNPVLLKPTGQSSSQIIIMGKAVGTMRAETYHLDYAEKAFTFVKKALATLCADYEVLLIEGAGSPAEVNLRANDIVNMRVAKYLNAPVLLIADIDRGGALASLVGTLALLQEDERALVKGLIINKFRGSRAILQPALDFLQERTGLPVVGVLPYMEKLDVDDEDSVALEQKKVAQPKAVRIAVLRLPKISNFTDFAVLEAEEDVEVAYVSSREELRGADLIVLPGSKNTTEDLFWLKKEGLEREIITLNKKGVPVLGICGGYQMLGEAVLDPEHSESDRDELPGLGLLPMVTVFQREKITRQVTARMERNPFLGLELALDNIAGYEIHSGESRFTDVEAKALFWLAREGDGRPDGLAREDGLVMGTHLHGLFDHDALRRAIINKLRERKGLAPGESLVNSRERKEAAYNRLADVSREHLDMEAIYKLMGFEAGKAP